MGSSSASGSSAGSASASPSVICSSGEGSAGGSVTISPASPAAAPSVLTRSPVGSSACSTPDAAVPSILEETSEGASTVLSAGAASGCASAGAGAASGCASAGAGASTVTCSLSSAITGTTRKSAATFDVISAPARTAASNLNLLNFIGYLLFRGIFLNNLFERKKTAIITICCCHTKVDLTEISYCMKILVIIAALIIRVVPGNQGNLILYNHS